MHQYMAQPVPCMMLAQESFAVARVAVHLAPTGALPLHTLPTTENWTAVQGDHVNGHSDGRHSGANGVGHPEVDLESGEAAPALHSSGEELSRMRSTVLSSAQSVKPCRAFQVGCTLKRHLHGLCYHSSCQAQRLTWCSAMIRHPRLAATLSALCTGQSNLQAWLSLCSSAVHPFLQTSQAGQCPTQLRSKPLRAKP